MPSCVSPKSVTATAFVCWRRPAARASRRKRSFAVSSATRRGFKTLTAAGPSHSRRGWGVQALAGGGPLDRVVGGAVDGAHAAHAEPRVESVLVVEQATDEWVFGRGGGCSRVGAQGRAILGADGHVGVKLPTALRALEHKLGGGEREFPKRFDFTAKRAERQ